MTDTPIKTIVCCADHDHATDPACEIKAQSVDLPLTTDEIAAQEAAAAQAAEEQAAREAEAAAQAALAESGIQKLIALGLTREEAEAMKK